MTEARPKVKTHELKIEMKYLERILDGSKNFEIRFNDRDFQKGDDIIFRPTTGFGYLLVTITYVLHFPQGLKEGYVALGIEATEESKEAFSRTYDPR